VGVVLVAPAAIGEWLNYWRPELLIYVVTRGAGLLFIGFVVVQLLRFIVYAPRVDSEVLCAAIAGYLLSGFAWSLAYALSGRLDPNSFVFTLGPKSDQSMNGFTGLYFSFITLSTVGYGDIIPGTRASFTLSNQESL
jgi:voltage-gated potassium channel